MSKKSKEQYLEEATQELAELEKAAAGLPGVLDVLDVMDNFDTANEGAVAYADAVDNAVFFSANNTAEA